MSKFGWSYPAGVTGRMIDEAYGHDEPCSMCGKWPDDCICPECPVCHVHGDPSCYVQSESNTAHGLLPNCEQITSLAEAEKQWAYLEQAQEKWPWK